MAGGQPPSILGLPVPRMTGVNPAVSSPGLHIRGGAQSLPRPGWYLTSGPWYLPACGVPRRSQRQPEGDMAVSVVLMGPWDSSQGSSLTPTFSTRTPPNQESAAGVGPPGSLHLLELLGQHPESLTAADRPTSGPASVLHPASHPGLRAAPSGPSRKKQDM